MKLINQYAELMTTAKAVCLAFHKELILLPITTKIAHLYKFGNIEVAINIFSNDTEDLRYQVFEVSMHGMTVKTYTNLAALQEAKDSIYMLYLADAINDYKILKDDRTSSK